MNPRRHPLLRSAIDLLEASGATDIRYHRSRHIRLHAIFRGRFISTTISVTPSSWSAGVKTLAELKRQMRAAEKNAGVA
jgi:hypothetical protein